MNWNRAVVPLIVLLGSYSVSRAQLNASFTMSASEGCSPLQVRFTNTSTGSPDSCFWQLGISGNTSNLFNPTAIYTAPGIYTVRLTVFKGIQSSTTTRDIRVFRDPVAGFTADILSGCEPLWVGFTESVTPGDAPVSRVQWDFGDGVVDSMSNPQHRYDFYGFKSVSLIAVDANGCKSTLVKNNYIQVLDRPAADLLSGNNENCKVPATVNFSAPVVCSVPIQQYNWTFGDGGTGTGSTPAHVYNAQGSYPVSLIVRAANGCYDTIRKNDFVRINPIIADFGASTFSGCTPATVRFFDSTNFLNITTLWNFRDGLTSTDRNPVHTFFGPGDYNVTLTATLANTTCSNTVSKTVHVEASPRIDFSQDKILSCLDELVQFTNLTTGAVRYRWYFINADNGNVDSSDLVNPLHFFSSPVNNDFHVRLVAESANGCTAEYFRPNAFSIRRDSVGLIIDQRNGCKPFRTDMRAFIEGIWPVSSIAWDFGDGSTATGASVSHTYANTGIFTVRMTVNIPGCVTQVRTDTVIVGIRDTTVSGSMDKFDVCVRRDSVHFIATGGLPGTTLIWRLGDNVLSSPDFYYTYNIPSFPQKYQVKLVALNSGCADTTQVGEILVRPPLARFRILPVCVGSRTITLVNSSIGADSVFLDLGDGTVYSQLFDTIVHTYSGNDLYYPVKLRVYNATSGCTDSTVAPLKLDPRNYTISWDRISGCGPTRVLFQVFGYDVTDTLYWEFSDQPGNYFQATALRHTFTEPGIYSVKLVIHNVTGCVDSIVRKDIIVISPVSGSLNAQTLGGCVTRDFSFAASISSPYSPVVQYLWEVEGNVYSTDTNVLDHTFADTGFAVISLKVTNAIGCELILSDTVEVKEKFAAFDPDRDTVCRGVPLQLRNRSSTDAVRFRWDFGDGAVSALRDPQHVYADTGVYLVTLTATDRSGCVDIIKKPIRVTILDFDFSADNRYRSCPELLANFSFSSDTRHFEKLVWDFGNGNTSVGLNLNPSTIYTYSGDFDVRLTVYDAYGCVDSLLKNDHVSISGPQGSFSFSPVSGCVPHPVEFSGNFQNIKSLTWDFGDGNVFADSTLRFRDTITHVYLSDGNYTPSIILKDDDACVAVVPALSVVRTGTIQTHILPLSAYVCNSGRVELADSSVYTNDNYPVEFSWYVNDVLTAAGPGFVRDMTYDPLFDPQEFKLVTKSVYGCISVDSVALKFYRTPAIRLDTGKVICRGETAQVIASGTGNFNWSVPSTRLNDSLFALRPDTTGFVYVQAYEVFPSCFVRDSVFVQVLTEVPAYLTPDTSMCFGDSVQLAVISENTSNNTTRFYWTPASYIDDVHLAAPFVFPPVSRSYTVTVSNGMCRQRQLPVQVRVIPLPHADAGPDTLIMAGMSVELQGRSPETVRFEWTPNGTLSCSDCPLSIASPLSTTLYRLTVTDSYGCNATDEVLVRVIEGCDGGAVFVPNLFTPDGNGRNDVLRVLGPGVDDVQRLQVFDRWGKLLFESQNIGDGWDGTYNGEPLPPGVYVYYVEVRCINGQTTVKKGDVTLLR